MAKNHASHRIEVVLFDAMFCLFEARGSRAKQLARVFFEEAGITVAPQRIWEVTTRIRHSLAPSSDYRRDWIEFNRRIIARLKRCRREQVPEELATRIQRRILWDASIYQVRDDMRGLLQWIKNRGVRLGIASNQDHAALRAMMSTFEVDEYFDEECIFTSDRITGTGEVVSKPHERFWALVQSALEVGEHPETVCFVGNSLRNDAPATRYGHPVALFDRCGHQHKLLPKEENPLLVFCRTTGEVWNALTQFGLP